MLEANKELVQRYYREATGGLWGIDEVVSADFVDHHFPPGMPPGPEGVRKFFGEVLGGIFRDVRIEIEYLLAEGNLVDCHMVVYMKHVGDFGDIPAKGNDIRCPAISTFRIAEGKLAEAWEIYDSGDLVRQMQA